ncbi:MAG: hypothetical protein ACNA8W_23495 [Bradymonadaceae bacterium]
MTTSIIEAAKSDRSKCGGCKKKIEKGSLRFGTYNERFESYRWFHLVCGAAIDARDFVEAAEEYEGDVGDVDAILEEAKSIGKGTKTPRVEPAPSARSSCVVCNEKIEPKGVLRGVLYYEVDVDTWRKGNTHVGCMAQLSDLDRDDLIEQVLENSILDDAQRDVVIAKV